MPLSETVKFYICRNGENADKINNVVRLSPQAKFFLLILSDVLTLYFSLFLVLCLRYSLAELGKAWQNHLPVMTLVFAAWLAIFYILGLYDFHRLRSNLTFFKILVFALGINFTAAAVFFYFFPLSNITPKTNLLLFLMVFGGLEILWRPYFNHRLYSKTTVAEVALIGKTEAARELEEFFSQNPEFGYRIKLRLAEEKNLQNLISASGINLLLVSRYLLKELPAGQSFFQLLEKEIEIKDIAEMYEAVFRRTPLSEVDEEWFLEHAANPRPVYEKSKRLIEWCLAFLFFILLLPLQILIALAIKLTSPGPVIYRQTRVGQRGKNFVLYKFRTMRQDAERDGPRWSELKDPRSTPIGQLLRLTHLDELPQLWNILNGELSFVGPRPERPEFVAKLKAEVPYYETRLLVKPGLTGWAQIHHRKDQTVEDVKKKIEYDLFYLKNRSLILDLAIFLKTIKMLFGDPK